MISSHKHAAHFQKLLLWFVAGGSLILSQGMSVETVVFGSGSFVLNDGEVYSDTGSYIGGGSYGSGSLALSGGLTIGGTEVPLWGPPIVPDNLPHSLEVAEEHGTVSKAPDLEIYDYDTSVTLTAVPDEGYVFVNWTEGPGKVVLSQSAIGLGD